MLRLTRGIARLRVCSESLAPVSSRSFLTVAGQPAAPAPSSAPSSAAGLHTTTTPASPSSADASSAAPTRPLKSPTQLVVEVLRTGPKTRKQILYAINQGGLTALPAAAPRRPQPEVFGQKQQAVEEEEPNYIPSGILRNHTHLTQVLQGLQRGKRLWALPYSSVAHRMGEGELASTRDILERQNALSRGRTSTLSAAQEKKMMAAQSKANWVYVLRDWADPTYAKKGEHKQALYKAKLERKAARREEAVQKAEEAGKPLQFGVPIRLSRRARRKNAKKEAEVMEKRRIRVAVRQYHKELFGEQEE